MDGEVRGLAATVGLRGLHERHPWRRPDGHRAMAAVLYGAPGPADGASERHPRKTLTEMSEEQGESICLTVQLLHRCTL